MAKTFPQIEVTKGNYLTPDMQANKITKKAVTIKNITPSTGFGFSLNDGAPCLSQVKASI